MHKKQSVRPQCNSTTENYRNSIEIEFESLNKQLLEMRRSRLPYCSYINSFKIDRAMLEPRHKKGNIHLKNMGSINTLIQMHLKRLNVKTKSKKDAEIPGLDVVSRHSHNYNIYSFKEISDQSKELIVSLEGKLSNAEPLKKRRTTKKASVAELLEKRLKKNKLALANKFRLVQNKDSSLNKRRSKRYWFRTLEKSCDNQLYLNQSIDSAIKSAKDEYKQSCDSYDTTIKVLMKDVNSCMVRLPPLPKNKRQHRINNSIM